MMNQEVREIMTTNPPTVHPNDHMDEVVEMMLKKKINQIAVVEDGKLAGLLTTFDIWRRSLDSQSEKQLHVKDVMNSKVLKITPIDKVGTAAELFMDRRFKTLPVVNLRNELKGVVTSFDVLRAALKEEYPNPILFKEVFQDA